MSIHEQELTNETSLPSVDSETESIMQKVIETEFASQTVIMVMHRLRYVTRFDRVCLVKEGELVECDSPSTLLAGDSEFAQFFTAFMKEH